MNKTLKNIIATIVICAVIVTAALLVYDRYVRGRGGDANHEPVPQEQTGGDQAKDSEDQDGDTTAGNGDDVPGNADDGTKDRNNGSPADEIDKELLYDEKGIIKPEYAEKIIKETADKVIQALKAKDAQAISGFVHPEKGLRFTPYTSVDLKQDLVFSAEEVRNFFADRKKYMWGYYDGTGDEIILTPAEYYDVFVYSNDFSNAEKIGYNEVLSYGNAVENQFEAYPGSIIVEYYFSGFDPKYEGMDWQSLRLVFEEYKGGWKLTGIIHNQWTI